MNCWTEFKKSKAFDAMQLEQKKYLSNIFDNLEDNVDVEKMLNDVLLDMWKSVKQSVKQQQVVDDMVGGAMDNKIHLAKIKSWLGGSIFDYMKNKLDAAIGLAQNISAKNISVLYEALEAKGVLKIYQKMKDDPNFYPDKISLLKLIQQGEEAISPEQLAKIPVEIRKVASVVREYLGDNGLIKNIREINPHIGIQKNYGLPFSLDGGRISTFSVDVFKTDMAKHLKGFKSKYFTDDKDWDRFLDDWYDEVSGSTVRTDRRTPKFDFYSRKLFFDNFESEFDILSKYGHLENGLLNTIEHHVISISTKASLWQAYGANPVQAISKSLDEIAQARRSAKGLSPDDVAQFNNMKREMHKLVLASRDGSPNLTTISYVSDTLKNMASLFYLGRLFVRDIASDKAHLAAYNMSAMREGSILNNFTKFYGAFGRYILDPQYRAQAKETLKTMQGSLEYANLRRLQEMGLHHIGLELGKGRTVTQATAQRIANWSRVMADGFFRIGMMNHARTFHTHQMSYTLKSSLSTVLRTTQYGKVNQRLKELLNSHGIFDGEFQVLNKVKRRKLTQSGDETIEVEDVLKLSDTELRPAMRKGETVADTRARLSNNLNSFIADEVRKSAGHASYTDLFLTSQHQPTTGFADTAIAHGTRFMPAALTFWRQLNDSISALSSGSAYQSGSKLTYASYAATRLATLTTTGIMVTWLADMARGRSPRELDAKTVALSAIGAGLGGAYGMILTSIILTEGRKIMGAAPTVAMVQKVVNYVIDPTEEKAVSLGKQFSGVGNIWYLENAFRALLYDATIGSPHTKKERRHMRETGQESIVPEIID